MKNNGYCGRLRVSSVLMAICVFLIITVLPTNVDSGVVSMIKAKKLAKFALIGAAIAPRLVIPLPPLSLPHHHHHGLSHVHHTSHVHHDWPWSEWDWSAFDHHDHHHHHFHDSHHHHKVHHVPDALEIIEDLDGWQ